jgi:hypothetical protein
MKERGEVMTLTINRLLRYTIGLTLGFILIGCGSQPIECPEDGDCDPGNQTYEPSRPEVTQQGWSASGILIPGNPNKVINFQTGMALGTYTLQFGLLDSYVHAPTETTRARAEVSWKVAGNNVRRVVDCVAGLSISGNAESVDVKIFDDSNFSPSGNGASQYNVSVQLAPGVRPTVERPPTFVASEGSVNGSGYYITTFADNTEIIAVPQDAGVISVAVTVSPDVAGALAPYQAIVDQYNGPGVGATLLKRYDPREEEAFVPLAPGCTSIRLRQDPALATTQYWTVTYGIDG